MYSLPYFKEKDEKTVYNFIRQHPFALVVGQSSTYPVATQIPLLIEEIEGKLFLKGHIMRHTDHCKAFEQNQNVICVFTGAHSYISASWYGNPQVASTWNYMSVHAKGVLQFLNHEELLSILQETTDQFENDKASPASYHHLPADYVDRLSKAIVAFSIEVKELEHVFKLSQNRNVQDFHSIMQQLKEGDNEAQTIAAEMAKRTDQLFSSSSD